MIFLLLFIVIYEFLKLVRTIYINYVNLSYCTNLFYLKKRYYNIKGTLLNVNLKKLYFYFQFYNK